MARGRPSGWCILRTQGRHTLRLAQTLAEDGFEVWTPIETRTVRVPRMNAKREVKLPIMPSYVFANAAHLFDLIELADMPVKPRRGAYCQDPAHENFSVMRCFGKIPMVPDGQFAELRRLEVRLTPRPRVNRTFAKGAKIKFADGSFAGLEAVVDWSERGATMVCFNDRVRVKIFTCYLNEDGVYRERLENGQTAEAA